MDMDIAKLVQDFGFPVVMVGGLGYFVYFVWQTITNKIDPAVSEMKTTIISTKCQRNQHDINKT